MTIILKQLFGFLKLLNSDKGQNQIAAGIACGLILGFSPALSLQTLLVFVLLFFFRIQMGAAFLSAFFFAFAAYLFDPVFHRIGCWFLEIDALKGLFTLLYNAPIIPMTKFNNSVVMGAGVVAVALFPFVFWGSAKLISKYREQVVAKFQQSKVWKLVKATSFYKWYVKYDNMFE